MPIVVDYSPVMPAMKMANQAGANQNWWNRFKAGQDVSVQELNKAQLAEQIRAHDIQQAMSQASNWTQQYGIDTNASLQQDRLDKAMQEAENQRTQQSAAMEMQSLMDTEKLNLARQSQTYGQQQNQQNYELNLQKNQELADYRQQMADANTQRSDAYALKQQMPVSFTKSPEYQEAVATRSALNSQLSLSNSNYNKMLDKEMTNIYGRDYPKAGVSEQQLQAAKQETLGFAKQLTDLNNWIVAKGNIAAAEESTLDSMVKQAGGRVTPEILERLNKMGAK